MITVSSGVEGGVRCGSNLEMPFVIFGWAQGRPMGVG
jgi:hypothetical protein